MKNAVSLYLGLPAVGHLYFRGPEKANTGNVLPETDEISEVRAAPVSWSYEMAKTLQEIR